MKIKNILVKNGMEVSAICATGSQALQAIEQLEGGVIVGAVRYADMLYNELSEYLSDYCQMLVIGTERQWTQYGDDQTAFLPIPFRAYELIDAVSRLLNSLESKFKSENTISSQRSEDDKMIITRAKERLMEVCNYSEEEAHRFLQKRSMDNGTSMVDTAYMVLDLY